MNFLYTNQFSKAVMKIPELPQVEFDEFPTNESTKVCIFTQPRYPVPDLSQSLKNGRNLSLFITETTFITIGRLSKKLPSSLFKLLPNGTDWLKIDKDMVDGLTTPFGVACLPTGCVSDSVMLLILLLNDTSNPKRLILYTGSFRECREVLISDLFLKYKHKITDLYIDNTFASSKHVDAIQNMRACDRIKMIVEKYPDFKVQLQIGMFDALDLLVDLAHRQQLNVKLGLLQQIFFYKSRYKHLFKYDAEIPNAAELNKNFRFKDRPKIRIVPMEVVDMSTFKRYFKEKIINIRLIASEKEINSRVVQQNGLFYISYAAHAGAFTLSQLFREIQPKRVHPIVEYELCDNSVSKIPEEILNEFCEIVKFNFEIDRTLPELNLIDTKPARTKRSFLEPSTVVSGTSLDEELSDVQDDLPNSTTNNFSPRSGENENDDVIDISDDEPVTVEAMCEIASRKRPSPKFNDEVRPKLRRINEMNNNQNKREDRTEMYNKNQLAEQPSTIQTPESIRGTNENEYNSNTSDSDSDGVIVFTSV